MGRKLRRKTAQPHRSRWHSVGLILAAAAGVAAIAFWWIQGAQTASGGTPRLVADRTEMDLGDFPFEKMARAVFTLTNAGNGPLRILDVSAVRALQGC